MTRSFDPRLAAAALGAAAVIEVLVRADESGVRLLLSVLLAVASTVPAGWLATHWTAAGVIVTAAFASLIVEPRVTVAGLITLVVTFYYAARHMPALFVGALLTPLALVAVGELVSGSGPAESNVVVDEGATFEEPDQDRSLPPEPDQPNLYPLLVASVSGAAAIVGRVQRSRATESAFQEKAATFAGEAAAHTARGERARIARELHDVVAHRISSIAVQAETARLTTPELSPDATRHLVSIGDSARDALSEMRRLLGVLRKDVDEAPGRQPQPGIAQLPQLVEDARELSGASVRLIVSGRVTPLDPGIELTAYRVVQESLTNARRHAPGAPVDIKLEYKSETVVVQIRDAGPGSDVPAGHGLLGMRERVAAVGGDLAAESGSVGGFVVTATLPRVVVEGTPSSLGSSHE